MAFQGWAVSTEGKILLQSAHHSKFGYAFKIIVLSISLYFSCFGLSTLILMCILVIWAFVFCSIVSLEETTYSIPSDLHRLPLQIPVKSIKISKYASSWINIYTYMYIHTYTHMHIVYVYIHSGITKL